MAYPLVENPVSATGVVVAPLPTKALSITRAWTPPTTWSPSTAGLTVAALQPFKAVISVRTWSGAIESSNWPLFGQGWPRITQH